MSFWRAGMKGCRVITVGKSACEGRWIVQLVEEDKGAKNPARIRVRKMVGNLEGRKKTTGLVGVRDKRGAIQ